MLKEQSVKYKGSSVFGQSQTEPQRPPLGLYHQVMLMLFNLAQRSPLGIRTEKDNKAQSKIYINTILK